MMFGAVPKIQGFGTGIYGVYYILYPACCIGYHTKYFYNTNPRASAVHVDVFPDVVFPS